MASVETSTGTQPVEREDPGTDRAPAGKEAASALIDSLRTDVDKMIKVEKAESTLAPRREEEEEDISAAELLPPSSSLTKFQDRVQQFAFSSSTRRTRSSSRYDSPVAGPSSSTPLTSTSSSKRKLDRPTPSASASTSTSTSICSPVSRNKRHRESASYAPPSKYSHLPLLPDAIGPEPILVFVGVNPGVRTAQTGHAYAHPSNLFWKLLYSSGITPRQCKPEEDQDMPALYMLGFTNIVARPTKDQSELSKAEMDARVVVLEEKIARWKPEAVCIVGKGIWESIWRVRHQRAIRPAEFRYGWQDESENMGMGVPRTKMQGWVIAGHEKDAVAPHQEREHARWSGARVFVATSTSGLAASMRPEEKEAVWKPLGEWVRRRREERGMTSGVGADSGVHGEGRESVKADEEEGGEEAT